MEPKIQSTTSTRALRSKIGPIKAYLFKASYVISPITPSDLKHSMKGAYKSFLSNLEKDNTESTNLADQYPEKVKELQAMRNAFENSLKR